MKHHVQQLTRIQGSKGSNPYDMCRIVVTIPSESRTGTTKAGDPYKVTSYGVDTTELDVTLDCFEKIARDVKLPATLELITDSELRFGRLISIVADYAVPQAKAA